MAEDRRKVVDAEDLLRWVYAAERVDRCDPGLGREMHMLSAMQGASGDGMSAVARYADLGVRVAEVSSGDERVHLDAHQVHGHVRRLETIERELVIRCGRAGARPDWGQGRERFRIVPHMITMRKREIVRVVKYDANRNEIDPYCTLDIVDCSNEVDDARGRYRVWHRGVSRLAETLMRNPWLLTAWKVSGFGAEKTPWAVCKTKSPLT